MKIYSNEDTIFLEYSRWGKRCNPHIAGKDQCLLGKYPTFTGLIIHHNKNNNDWTEMGFAGTIDRSYKGKNDDVGSFIVMWEKDEESFRSKCKELNLNIHELEV